MIVDDSGAGERRTAVDDYFRQQGMQVELQPIDFSGRFILKKAMQIPLSRAA